jgi:hypothetical protein
MLHAGAILHALEVWALVIFAAAILVAIGDFIQRCLERWGTRDFRSDEDRARDWIYGAKERWWR